MTEGTAFKWRLVASATQLQLVTFNLSKQMKFYCPQCHSQAAKDSGRFDKCRAEVTTAGVQKLNPVRPIFWTKYLKGLIFLSLGSSAFAAWKPVEGLIEGQLLHFGQPIVGAEITSCMNGKIKSILGESSCEKPIKTITDANGRFSFHQLTGVTPPTREEIKKSPVFLVADPGWNYGFRVDFEGMAAFSIRWGMGYGRTHVRMECDFGAFLAKLKKDGIRPVTNPDNKQVINCANSETALMPVND